MTPTNLMKLIHLISSINKNGTLIILKFQIIIALHKTGFRQGSFFLFLSFCGYTILGLPTFKTII